MDNLKKLRVFVKTSTVREKVLNSFNSKKDFLSPSEISKNTKLALTVVSTALLQLQKEKLVNCLTPEQSSHKQSYNYPNSTLSISRS